MSERTLLTRLEELCNVDVDDADHDFIRGLPFKPHNQTSNQVVMTETMLLPRNRPLLLECIKKYGSQGWEAVFDEMSVRICAENLPFITGRALTQTTPRHLNDKDAIVDQCRRFAKSFEAANVPRDRFAIKVPFSGAGAVAAKQLNAEGIRVLATAVFCLEQAIAASQSHCLFISPYYNGKRTSELESNFVDRDTEIAAHIDPSQRPNVKDSALEHPMSPRIIHILEAFTALYKKTGEEQPIMVIASHFHNEELMAMAELGCQHVTIQQPRLKDLMAAKDNHPPVTRPKATHPYATLSTPERLRALSKLDPLAGTAWDGVLPAVNVDYLAADGERLNRAIQKDGVAAKRVKDAMDRFLDAEAKAKAAIEAEMQNLGL
ncbi:hypothetical protein Neosp_002983 [[Neocosmospora] mangrovei]